MNKIPCVYKIVCCTTKQYYIGSTNHYVKRVQQHKSHLNRKTHPNDRLQFLANIYGCDNFKYNIIERCELDQLHSREQHYLDMFIGRHGCLNLSKTAKDTKLNKVLAFALS